MAASSLRVGAAQSFPTAGQQVFSEKAKGVQRVRNRAGLAEHHRAAVVHGGLEGAAGVHKSVQQRHRRATRSTIGQGTHEPAARGTVQQQAITVAGTRHRQHVGLAVVDYADVRHEAGVQYGIQRVLGPGGLSRAPGALSSLSCRIPHHV
ncbi:MAG: hypothetical protein V9G10_04300 [Candidatus Nanopelagicales bacterium]